MEGNIVKDIFRDVHMNKLFFEFGYFFDEILTAAEVDVILNYIKEIPLEYKDGFNISFSHNLPEVRKNTNEFFNVFFKDKINRLVNGYKVFCSGVALKKPGNNSYFFLHSDDSICDESKYTPFSLWIPLVDVNKENGCMAMIPGSHLLTSTYRSTPYSEPILKYESEIKNQFCETIELKAGQGIVFNPSMLHFSYENITPYNRPALIIACMPEEAEPVVMYNSKFLIWDRYHFYDLTDDLLYTWDWNSKPKTNKRYKIQPLKQVDFKSSINLLQHIKNLRNGKV